MLDSPYTASFGIRPTVVAGRSRDVARVANELNRMRGSRSQARMVPVFTGVRGIGKTVMLGLAASEARERGFATLNLTLGAKSVLTSQIATGLTQELGNVRSSSAANRMWERLGSVSLNINLGVLQAGMTTKNREPAGQVPAATGETLAGTLIDATHAAVGDGKVGLVLLLDEIQEPPLSELTLLNTALQTVMSSPDAGPFMALAAGLPNAPDKLAGALSFAERYEYREIGALTPDEASFALLDTARLAGVSFTPDAEDLILQAAQGSPYLVQLYGDKAWEVAAPERPGAIIQQEHAREGIEEGLRQLSSGLFRSRWNRATPEQQRVLTAIAQVMDDRGTATVPLVSAILGGEARQWSRARAELRDKGLVDTSRYGKLSFTMPGFEHFVLAESGADKLSPEVREALAAAAPSLSAERPRGRHAAPLPGEAPALPGRPAQERDQGR